MKQKLKLLRRLMGAERFNIAYIITGKCDGSWQVQAIDQNYELIGVSILVATPTDAWKIYMMLNGYSYEPVQFLSTPDGGEGSTEAIDDLTKEVA